MNRLFTLVALVAVSLLPASCRTWGTAEGTHWAVMAPPKVGHNPNDKLVFSVETTTPEGNRVEGISYVWQVEWVNVHGSNHKGRSYEPQSITVKGGPGTAYLRIYAYDKNQKLAEVAIHPFVVGEAVVTPPAH
jgi:hypothetical protein